MAILRNDEVVNMDNDDLQEKVQDLNLELAKERGKIAVGGFPENPGRIKEIRRTIARIKTEMNDRRRNDG